MARGAALVGVAVVGLVVVAVVAMVGLVVKVAPVVALVESGRLQLPRGLVVLIVELRAFLIGLLEH